MDQSGRAWACEWFADTPTAPRAVIGATLIRTDALRFRFRGCETIRMIQKRGGNKSAAAPLMPILEYMIGDDEHGKGYRQTTGCEATTVC